MILPIDPPPSSAADCPAASSAAAASRGGEGDGGRGAGSGDVDGGGMRGGGAMRGGGGVTNVYMAPPMFSPFGFGMPFSPFGFGFGFGIPLPLLLFAAGGLALSSFRSNRGIDAVDKPGAALCLQVACFCGDRRTSLYGRLQVSHI